MSSARVSSQVRPPSEHEPTSDHFRILSIDGGGVRGVIPAVLLERLEELLKVALEKTRADPSAVEIAARWQIAPEPRIADCFHLIAGTSTGGLLAAALTVSDAQGRPKLSATATVDIWETHVAKIFKRPLLRNLLDHWNILLPRYPLIRLREVLEDPALFGDSLLKDARTDVLISTYDASLLRPRFFTRWGAPGASDVPTTRSETMVDAALATAAAPIYFDPHTLDLCCLVDGGMFAGNPALAAISMALRRTDDLAPRAPNELMMMSLGTGVWGRPLTYGWGGIFGWHRPRPGGGALLEALLAGQADFATEAAHMMLNGWSATPLPTTTPTSSGERGLTWWDPTLPPASLGGGPRFWRYQTPLPEPWAMDDVSRVAELKRLGLEMAQYFEDELRRIAEMLIQAGPVPPQ